jgi:hypothetical protein
VEAAGDIAVRDIKVNVDMAGHTVIERATNSMMVTNRTAAPAGPARRSRLAEDSGRGAGEPQEASRGSVSGPTSNIEDSKTWHPEF